MGIYLNPPKGDKSKWLRENGTETTAADLAKFADFTGPNRPVVLVDNGVFTAAAVGFSAKETAYFLCDDDRPKEYFLVPVEKMKSALPQVHFEQLSTP